MSVYLSLYRAIFPTSMTLTKHFHNGEQINQLEVRLRSVLKCKWRRIFLAFDVFSFIAHYMTYATSRLPDFSPAHKTEILMNHIKKIEGKLDSIKDLTFRILCCICLCWHLPPALQKKQQQHYKMYSCRKIIYLSQLIVDFTMTLHALGE